MGDLLALGTGRPNAFPGKRWVTDSYANTGRAAGRKRRGCGFVWSRQAAVGLARTVPKSTEGASGALPDALLFVPGLDFRSFVETGLCEGPAYLLAWLLCRNLSPRQRGSLRSEGELKERGK
ncbi:hypothetical protein SKAU_G00293470 [Synaphobranchus kaupii]|uniref:Uncharacterized protein n=1 Tax=Synaphobranchus kaupii TaxID=118154 RepID=A0A9Q1EUC5_SYNKA|nr:hypothetical protein SKAU_G00293470 [Synaphobranchus kaupii]